MSRTGPRSNFSLLPFRLRCRIIFMLQDGATFDAVASDPEIALEYQKRGLRLTAPAVTGIRKSAEYQELARKRRDRQLSDQADQLTAELLRDSCELETVSEQVKVNLLRLVQDCVRANPDDTKEVERLVRSAVNLSNPAKDNQIAELKRKIREKDERIEAIEKEHAEEVARLNVELAERDKTICELRNGKKNGVSEETLQEVEKKIGLL